MSRVERILSAADRFKATTLALREAKSDHDSAVAAWRDYVKSYPRMSQRAVSLESIILNSNIKLSHAEQALADAEFALQDAALR